MDNNQNNKNIVYILTNEAMPNLVKIGKTDTTIEQRMQDLYKTGVPVPFECFHASIVKDSDNVEKRIHNAFDKYRVNKNREFFEIPPENILEILEMVELEDITPQKDFVETEDDRLAIEKLEKKTERFNFKLIGIGVGTILTFSKDDSKTCKVISNNKILYNQKETSLSTAALEALRGMGYNWKSAHGPAYWVYNGETLKDRWNRIQSE